ncbi:MAG: ABC transporter ATP-binding protein [Eubacteriales bacterium]|nr:ABC transporter ATP-binding protein [Eubacteriales bacterium]
MKIEIKNLDYRIGKKQLLNNISMEFSGKRMIGLLGPNGSGKTTLLRHLYRELPSKGAVCVDGQDIADCNRRALAQKIAVMAQRMSQTDSGLTVSDIVQMGRYPYKGLLEQYDEQDERMVEEALARTGLTELRHRRLGTMSGGEVQRAMIAKCFVQDPEVIILDEPTNHLDIKYKLELMQLLTDYDGLVILTLHDLDLAARYCDYLYILKDGSLCAEGKPAEVLTEELLEQVFEVHFHVMRDGDQIYLNIG